MSVPLVLVRNKVAASDCRLELWSQVALVVQGGPESMWRNGNLWCHNTAAEGGGRGGGEAKHWTNWKLLQLRCSRCRWWKGVEESREEREHRRRRSRMFVSSSVLSEHDTIRDTNKLDLSTDFHSNSNRSSSPLQQVVGWITVPLSRSLPFLTS